MHEDPVSGDVDLQGGFAHPDFWWGGHDLNVWWVWLPEHRRQELLALGHGDQPPLGEWISDLRGAVVDDDRPEPPRDRWKMRRPWRPRRLSDAMTVFLDEKRAERRGEL
ncbi:hypothetical protein [Kineococcus terrestris]|uniref:hypothetical protein n=1 Tax=Kineococcus terrestris TaxID=2044856 RepID=UPI0034DB3F92